MPEGDTIHRAAITLQMALAGREVLRFETAFAQLAVVDDQTPVRGRVVEGVAAIGKHLLIGKRNREVHDHVGQFATCQHQVQLLLRLFFCLRSNVEDQVETRLLFQPLGIGIVLKVGYAVCRAHQNGEGFRFVYDWEDALGVDRSSAF